MQKQRIPQPQVEPIPVEVRVLRRQCRQLSDQTGVIVMIPQYKVELALGDSFDKLTQPLNRCGETRLE